MGTNHGGGGQFWTPITPDTRSIFHADQQCAAAKRPAIATTRANLSRARPRKQNCKRECASKDGGRGHCGRRATVRNVQSLHTGTRRPGGGVGGWRSRHRSLERRDLRCGRVAIVAGRSYARNHFAGNLMRWPWQRETRDSGGDFSDAVVRLLEAQAAGSAADASSTAAVEAGAWAQHAVSPTVLAQIGRDLIRSGDSMHAIRVDGDGVVSLIPCSSWHFEGSHDPATWTVRATAYGPSTSTTWNLPATAVAIVRWGSAPGQTYVGTGPLLWAHTTVRLQSEAERSLADEAGGPLAQLLSVPQDGGDDGDGDPLKMLKSDLRQTSGRP